MAVSDFIFALFSQLLEGVPVIGRFAFNSYNIVSVSFTLQYYDCWGDPWIAVF